MQILDNKITGNQLTAAEWNQPMSELQNVIEAFGFTLNGADVTQVLQALSVLNARQGYYVIDGSSTANSWVLDTTWGPFVPTALTDGLQVRFVAPNDNAGPSLTITVGGLAAKGVRTALDNELSTFNRPDHFITGKPYTLQYHLDIDAFVPVTPYNTATEDDPGILPAASIANLNDPNGTSLDAIPTPVNMTKAFGYREINKVLAADFDITEGTGLATVTGLTIPLDGYDTDVGGTQIWRFEYLVRISISAGTQDGIFKFSVSNDSGGSLTLCLINTAQYNLYGGTGGDGIHSIGPDFASALNADIILEVPDAVTTLDFSDENVGLIKGIVKATAGGQSLIIRGEHTGTGSATVSVVDSSYGYAVKIEEV